jgi:hypothetical protein
MFCPSHTASLRHPNKIWLRLQVMNEACRYGIFSIFLTVYKWSDVKIGYCFEIVMNNIRVLKAGIFNLNLLA